MRKDRASIYNCELEKLLDQGLSLEDAQQAAAANAEEIYWDLVDQGRQEAKDRNLP